ncbi:hypothetical protein HZB93_03000, partial [Candidatus Falkowbacteria bacterium]|nr:hypothetical protein [Candidatus Falkowbacteria bacterium]
KISPLDAEFGSYPVAELLESGNEADYFTNAENIRNYAYEIFIFVEAENQGLDAAYSALRSAVDALIDAFDADYTLSGVADGGIDAAPSSFSDFRGRGGKVAVAVITLKCHKTKVV